MSGREWKPGDVAKCTGCRPGVVMVRTEDGKWLHPGYGAPQRMADRELHPLVVMDPADNLHRSGTAEWADWIEDQYVEQTKPPKPAEPKGLGAVVEGAGGVLWVRAGKSYTDPNWRVCGGSEWIRYADIPAVRVLSEGVPS